MLPVQPGPGGIRIQAARIAYVVYKFIKITLALSWERI
jgi:hypothetical protein